jgi:hypothetical protein
MRFAASQGSAIGAFLSDSGVRSCFSVIGISSVRAALRAFPPICVAVVLGSRRPGANGRQRCPPRTRSGRGLRQELDPFQRFSGNIHCSVPGCVQRLEPRTILYL